MSLKQTRRSVSLARSVYEAARDHAARAGLTLAHFVELAVRAQGVEADATHHQTRAAAQSAKRGRQAAARNRAQGWRSRPP